MSDVKYFFWLAGQAVSVLVLGWPITLLLVAGVVITIMHAARRGALITKAVVWSLVPGIVPVVILAWGVMFEREGDSKGRGQRAC